MTQKSSIPGVIARLALAALAATGCAGWKRAELADFARLRPRQQVQVWRGAQVTVLHAVSLERDTVFGTPFIKPRDCDSCRVAIPKAMVDSLRLGDQETPGMILGMAPIVALVGFALLFAVSYRGD